jgi:hypothetical protein
MKTRWRLPTLRQWHAWWTRPIPPARWQLAGFVLLGGFILMPLVNQLPLLGFDWHRLFYAGFLDQYPPWMIPLFAPFRWIDWRWSLALSNSLSLVGIATLTAIQAPQIKWSGLGAAALALLSPPLKQTLVC